MESFPKTGASTLVARDKKVLLIQRKNMPYQGAWSLPGGSQIFGETLEACALRELHEETGLVARSAKFMDIKEIISSDESGEVKYHFLLGIYLVSDFEGTLKAMDDTQDANWFTREECAQLKTSPELFPHICELLGKENITF